MKMKRSLSFLIATRSFLRKSHACSARCSCNMLKRCSSTACRPTIPENTVLRHLRARIKASGPITVADYMREVLLNPVAGYYMHRDVFGKEGDFVTSPEISQMFGELLTVWFLNEWQKIGCPRPLQIVELGPGRGSLMRDILKVFQHFGSLEGVSGHLVEASQHLSSLQAHTLCVNLVNPTKDELYYQSGRTSAGVPVYWYRHIQEVPHEFSFIYANEFFDALPIHKLQKTDEGWKEVLVDIDPQAGEDQFRYVISRGPTPASKFFIKPDEKRDHIEVSPQSEVIMQHLATRLEEDGGIALVADYGHDGEKTDTFRAFRKHQLHNPLVEPGSADLTADVDFSRLRAVAEPQLITFGPVNQGDFLERLGISVRLQVLYERGLSCSRMYT
ncbi:protein arginine methyltransferase NDUFAF7, mitochondrial isoform X2 [Anabrus simplex]|uniref:protein arginine methyltransferase NDUFAF7, mitochondrial isoform X2 n=1 Tax=Anabrus simplex TaxID=316456 RepID=UPI0035A2A418